MSESFAQLFEDSLEQSQLKLASGDIVSATVMAITKEFVIVNVGLKSEGIIAIEQFKGPVGELEIAVGDKIDVAIEVYEDGTGTTRVSREKAKRAEEWTTLEKIQDAGESVTGTVSGKIKGGFTVELNTVHAFLPGSLVDIRPVRDTSHIEGQTLEFKIIKLDQKRNNIVVSRRAVLEAATSTERDALLDTLEEGQEVTGVVKNLTDYGAFVDLGGIDGLLHVTDMSWKRVKHPNDVVNVGQELTLKILKFDRERQRVSLGIKQCVANPWSEFLNTHQAGDQIKGTIKSITDFGIFIGLTGNIDGLVHLSDISWNESGEEAIRHYKKGDEVAASVLAIDAEKERISLGIKQLQDDPHVKFYESHKKGSMVSGKISEIGTKKILIDLGNGLRASMRAAEATKEQATGARAALQVGDEITGKITNIDRKTRNITIALTVKELPQAADALKAYERDKDVSGTNLGDLLKDKIDNKEAE